MTLPDYLATLNPAQREAVCAHEGPVLVLAGAGAGKTKTIAHRMVHLAKNGTPASSLLAITFTNKAAREMRERTLALLHTYGEASRGTPTVSTFHALSANLLRRFGETVGVPRNFVIADRTDSLRAVKTALQALHEDEKRFEPRGILSAISRVKGDGISYQTYKASARGPWQEVVAEVWARYDALFSKDNTVDFDDLLLKSFVLVRDHPEVRERLQHEWCHLLVDEYQDTNKVQYAFARFLAGERASIFVVGDEDQCLYSWRGASVEHILRFEEDFPEAQVFRLEQNYRSTKTIIAVSNDIIQKNKKRKHKTLFTENPDGERVTLLVGFDEHDEAEKVTEAISGVLAQGVPPEEVAVLYRANFQSRVLEEAFLGAGLPYQVLGTRFFDRKEIKDTLAYLRATLNPASETDIRRIINTPTRGIGAVTTDALFEKGRAGLSGAPALKVEKFFTLLDTLRVSVEKEKASEAIKTVLALSGLAESFSGKNEEDQERLENVRELVSLATTRYDALPPREGIEQLLEDAALATDQDELDSRAEKKGVRLMTVHASKGLEFRVVCVTGLEDGLFPHARMGGEDYDEEEERRLFYVALTRAKEKVFLSYALSRMVFGRTTNGVPSEFVLEIDEAYLEEKDRPSRGKVIYLD